MSYINRQNQISSLFPNEPKFRLKQIEQALFKPEITSWSEVTNLSKNMRETLESQVPFLSLSVDEVKTSDQGNTYKAILKTIDDLAIESVLMKNSRGYWTICISTQIGCAMRCSFCATGKMGLKRNLDQDEIVDQVRVWQQFLAKNPDQEQRISNLVYMGMGEPMANYENVRASLNTILAQTEIGPTKITVSTVGVLPRLEMLLSDPEWPHVKLAVSLHSADRNTRKEIVPTSYDDFLPKLADWSKRYLERFGNRRHYLTFEYVMLEGVNDSIEHAKMLANFVNRIGEIKVNLIPFNFTECGFGCSDSETIEEFRETLNKKGVAVTTRKSQGQDIGAACGQLLKIKTDQPES
ncbi:23S rRNA (adenine(2503)-C(2))-methyltransferase RlmN [Patescibacteria group bacterium]